MIYPIFTMKNAEKNMKMTGNHLSAAQTALNPIFPAAQIPLTNQRKNR